MQLLIFVSSLLYRVGYSWALFALPFRVVGSNGLFSIWLHSQPSGRAICANLLRDLVGSNGLGPSTSRLSGVCSNQLSYEPMYGGGNRVRTDDPLLAGQVLYQLSYTPIPLCVSAK